MCKTFVMILILLVSFSSCRLHKKVNVPEYTDTLQPEKTFIAHEPIKMPGDTTRNIVVYNVVEKQDKKLKITDETIRLLIADFFGTLTTVITVWQMQEQTP